MINSSSGIKAINTTTTTRKFNLETIRKQTIHKKHCVSLFMKFERFVEANLVFVPFPLFDRHAIHVCDSRLQS